jgi:phytoene dehydrogenase-like protein
VNLPEPEYRAEKARWFGLIHDSALRFLPDLRTAGEFGRATVATDMFTPRTVAHYTGHLGGAIYGSPEKNPEGKTALSNVYLCGTDQGMLGIVGSMLSGITMANEHILKA